MEKYALVVDPYECIWNRSQGSKLHSAKQNIDENIMDPALFERKKKLFMKLADKKVIHAVGSLKITADPIAACSQTT